MLFPRPPMPPATVHQASHNRPYHQESPIRRRCCHPGRTSAAPMRADPPSAGPLAASPPVGTHSSIATRGKVAGVHHHPEVPRTTTCEHIRKAETQQDTRIEAEALAASTPQGHDFISSVQQDKEFGESAPYIPDSTASDEGLAPAPAVVINCSPAGSPAHLVMSRFSGRQSFQSYAVLRLGL